MSYLGLTAHYFNNYELISIDLCCKKLEESHTGEYLSETIIEVLNQFRISEKIGSITTDNGANVVKACSLLGMRMNIERFPCLGHVMNLIVRESLS